MNSSRQISSRQEAARREARQREILRQEARRHYLRGNRYFDSRLWDQALQEWRRAAGIWRSARSAGRRALGRFAHLRAALAFLLTVGMVYLALFTFFPRDSFEMVMLTGSGQDGRSWWERFLETGRESSGESRKMGVREWWRRFKRRLEGGQERRLVRSRGGRPSIDDRWEELLRRHGRWGPNYNFDLDYNIISGYGLSRLGDYEQAVEAFKKGIRENRERARLADLYQGLANAHYFRGYLLQEDGLARYDLEFVRKASWAYEKSVGYQPRPVSYGNLGWMYFLLGEYEEAGEFSRKALKMDQGLEYVRLNLGLVYLKQGRAFDAFEVYRSVIRRNPPDEVYLGGINDLREVLRDNPGRVPFAYLMLGLLALKKGDYGVARDALSRFQANPLVGQSWRRLARRLSRGMNAEDFPR